MSNHTSKAGTKGTFGFSMIAYEFVEMCHEAGYIHSPLKETHLMAANKLIWEGEGEEHKEPFDRILLAQAKSENMHFMTSDGKIPGFKQNCVIAV